MCTEIIEYSSPDEFAVCNLASIGLPKFIKNGEFDYDSLRKIVKIITKNLNKVIDINYYPVPQTRTSNKRHRPIGIGVQGLADVFAILKIPFDSDKAKYINKKIFENIYYASLEMSMEISKKREIEIKELQKLKEDMVAPARRRAPAPPAPPPAPPAPPVDLPTENEEYLTAVRIEEPAGTSLIKEQPFQTERVNQTQFPGHEHQSAQLSRTDEALHRVKAQLSRTDEALHKAIRENQSFRTENESLRAKTTAFAVQNEQLSRENEELTIMCNFLIKTLDKHGINVEEESLQ